MCKYEMEDYENALHDFNKAIELKEDDDNFWRECKYQMEDYENALPDLNKAIELKDAPEYWHFH